MAAAWYSKLCIHNIKKHGAVQVDVIEAQSSILSQCIANAQDFSEAERAHQTFLDAVVTQSFLDMKAISQMLEGIFSLCQRLCGFVQVNKLTFPDTGCHAISICSSLV